GLEVLDALPEMASLDMGLSAVTIGGVDHPILWTRTFLRNAAKMMLDRGIKPELEIYHDGMFTEAHMLIEEGLLTKPYFFSFVMGMTRGQGKVPYTPKHLLHLVDLLPPDSLFSVIGIGPSQLPATTMSILLGGNVRVGFEDNVYYRRGELAESNAQLVARTARLVRELGFEVASPQEAREMLRMPPLVGA
ncbi:MAG: 3-keto-5-aminohexanoate cleavage protein, partial [Actinobacteria bacterium]|nr:3-keto-5-aminohexanoate cleavage protein [Actinomycetota bacterium]